MSSISLVRYCGNDYSVPTRYGHREVQVKGYVDTVVITHASQVIARHKRSYQRGDFVFDRKRGRRQTLRGGSLRARLNGPACVDAWRLGCRKVMADQAAGAAV